MPVQWNEQNLKRLLLAVFAASKVDGGAVATAWQQLYGPQCVEVPTRSAIIQQIQKLKKSLEKPMQVEPSPSRLKNADNRILGAKVASEGPSRTERDDSEVMALPSTQRSLSVKPKSRASASPRGASAMPSTSDTTVRDESVAVVEQSTLPVAAAAVSDVPDGRIKVEESESKNQAAIVIDDSDSATEGRFVTPCPVPGRSSRSTEGLSRSTIGWPVCRRHENAADALFHSNAGRESIQIPPVMLTRISEGPVGIGEPQQSQLNGKRRHAHHAGNNGKKRRLDEVGVDRDVPQRPAMAYAGPPGPE